MCETKYILTAEQIKQRARIKTMKEWLKKLAIAQKESKILDRTLASYRSKNPGLPPNANLQGNLDKWRATYDSLHEFINKGTITHLLNAYLEARGKEYRHSIEKYTQYIPWMPAGLNYWTSKLERLLAMNP